MPTKPYEFYRDREGWGGHVFFVYNDDKTTLVQDKHGEPERFSWDDVVKLRDEGWTVEQVLAARATAAAELPPVEQPSKRGRRG